MSLSDTKRHECHIQSAIINVKFIACEIDRRSIKHAGSIGLEAAERELPS
jgi:hypothetical protein